jgi:hypothetical protein
MQIKNLTGGHTSMKFSAGECEQQENFFKLCSCNCDGATRNQRDEKLPHMQCKNKASQRSTTNLKKQKYNSG